MNAKRPDDFAGVQPKLEEPKAELSIINKVYIIPEGYKTPVKELESKLLKRRITWSGIDKLCEIFATDESSSQATSATSRLRTTVYS